MLWLPDRDRAKPISTPLDMRFIKPGCEAREGARQPGAEGKEREEDEDAPSSTSWTLAPP